MGGEVQKRFFKLVPKSDFTEKLPKRGRFLLVISKEGTAKTANGEICELALAG
jgi:hypothetical protein